MKFLCILDTLVQVNATNSLGVKETVVNLRAQQNEMYDSDYDLTKYAPECFINLDASGGTLPPSLPVEPPPPLNTIVTGATIVGKESKSVLQQMAKEKGVPGNYRMNKTQLRTALGLQERQEMANMAQEDTLEAQE